VRVVGDARRVGSGETLRPIELLADLIRIPSVNPDGEGEGPVAELLRDRLDVAGLTTTIEISPGGRPSLVGRVPGPTDVAPLVLLSHTDVVPVEPDAWRHDPFGGEIVDGELWGRGALDMKSIAVLHAEAAAALAASGATPTREVVVVAVADEEAGGAEGAGWLLDERPELVGFREGAPPPEVLGEGAFGLSGLLERPVMPIVQGEKAPLAVRVRARCRPGHGSMPPADQAIQRLLSFVDRVSGPRRARIHPVMRDHFAALAVAATGPERRVFELLASGAGPAAVRALAPLLRSRSAAIGQLVADSVTPTMLSAGYKLNVVPGEAEATFDCRLLPDTDPDEVLAELRRAGGGDVEVEVVQRWATTTSPRGELFEVLADASSTLPHEPIPVPSLTPGVTDVRYFRAAGATGYGWVPLVLTPELLATFHGHDERVPVAGFEEAVDVMTDVVRRVST
jgi:acetylornithine deacetylase/succinyl-diaminopimelate desuccinylase-like protein